jgi:hypothetical protein
MLISIIGTSQFHGRYFKYVSTNEKKHALNHVRSLRWPSLEALPRLAHRVDACDRAAGALPAGRRPGLGLGLQAGVRGVVRGG